VIETLTLWDDTPKPDTVRTPATWIEHHGISQSYHRGCRCQPCTAAKADEQSLYRQGLRRCQYCKNTYPRKTGGGSKFCSACATTAYARNQPKPKYTPAICIRCATEYRARTAGRWQLCPACTQHPVFKRMVGSLAAHKAPDMVVLAVMEWPYCANEQCGQWLLERIVRSRHTGSPRLAYNWAIDHDHDCCPGEHSCGRCIRGILCVRCNQTLAHDQTDKLAGLIDYLTAAP
jgi:hypothetical protein